jgi:hypothetical protein
LKQRKGKVTVSLHFEAMQLTLGVCKKEIVIVKKDVLWINQKFSKPKEEKRSMYV